MGAEKGIDYVGGFCDSLVLSPCLCSAFLKYSNPVYREEDDKQITERVRADLSIWLPQELSTDIGASISDDIKTRASVDALLETEKESPMSEKVLLSRLDELESRARRRLDLVNDRLEDA